MLRVGTGLTSLDTHCFGSVSDGAGSTELGMVDSNDDVGDSIGFGVGICRDVIGDDSGGVHVIGALAEGFCLVFFPVTGTRRIYPLCPPKYVIVLSSMLNFGTLRQFLNLPPFSPKICAVGRGGPNFFVVDWNPNIFVT